MKKLKLYVWRDVLRDYSCGIAFALAESPEEARQLVIENMGYEHDDIRAEPTCVTTKEAFVMYGGM